MPSLGPGERAFLTELEPWPAPSRRLNVLLRRLADFDHEIDALAGEIDQRARADVRVAALSSTS